MKKSDLLTIELLQQYMFVLHENISEITKKEINEARRFAKEYLKKNSLYKTYNPDFLNFVHRKQFHAITGVNNLLFEYQLSCHLVDYHSFLGENDWIYEMYYDFEDYPNGEVYLRWPNENPRTNAAFIYDFNRNTIVKGYYPPPIHSKSIGYISSDLIGRDIFTDSQKRLQI